MPRRRWTPAISVLLLALTACGAPETQSEQLASSSNESTSEPSDEPDPELTDAPIPQSGETQPDVGRLNELTVADEGPRTGYSRKQFKHWSDLDGDGCTTREEVLIAESLVALTLGSSCKLVGGSWFSPYDGKSTTKPSTFDIDHFVPLAEAWDSGAKRWTAEQREQYANDLDHPDALIGVTGSSNRSKSDRDPAEWMPSREEFWCTYAATWVDIKLTWNLTVDEDELARLRDVLNDC